MDTLIVRVDPLDQKIGAHIFPAVLQRVYKFADDSFSEVEADTFTRQVGARAFADEEQLLLAALTEKGLLIGHALSTLQEEGGKKWVYGIQCYVDKNINAPDAGTGLIQATEEWGKVMGAKELMFITRRSDIAWTKKHGFTSSRSVMEKSLVPEKEGERGWGSSKEVPKT